MQISALIDDISPCRKEPKTGCEFERRNAAVCEYEYQLGTAIINNAKGLIYAE